jgi:hypothetical protein
MKVLTIFKHLKISLFCKHGDELSLNISDDGMLQKFDYYFGNCFLRKLYLFPPTCGRKKNFLLSRAH